MKTIETTQTPEKGVNVRNVDDTTNHQVARILKMESRNLDYEKITQNLVFQLQEYLEKSQQKWFVIGVSGWIDSALVSTLCALSGASTLVLDLPIHQKSEEVNRAHDHMNWLQTNFPNIERNTVDLTQTFETLKSSLPEIQNPEWRYLAEVNTRSRLRAVTLYALWNEKNYLVAWTGNKVEDYGIWFFTKFGDGAVDVSPIWNLYKSEVYALAKHLGIIQSILQARPTDGLHENGATDEDQIGATYDELEWAMGEYDAGKRATDFTGRDYKVMEIYTNRHEKNAHKMEMPPIFNI